MIRAHAIVLISVVALLAIPPGLTAQTHTVDQSVHNLSVTGPGTVKVSTDVGVCIFCHAPHNGVAMNPIWNKQLPPDNYQQYSSTTYNQKTNLISDQSKLCLSCHDGTIALGQTVATGDLGSTPPMHAQNVLGTNLALDHPISFTLPAQDDGEIKPWLLTSPLTSPDPAIKLWSGKIECSTCHEPHVPDRDPIAQKFLRRSNLNGAICTNCHDGTRGDLANYPASQHAVASNAVSANAGMSYSTVNGNACLSCHTSHNAAGGGPRLLRGVEEATCATCHGPSSAVSPAPSDIISGLTTAQYKHPVLTVSGAHDLAEPLPVNTTRHSECADCHNPHVAQAETQPAIPPAVQPPLRGAKGVSAMGASVVAPAVYEYQVCLKCHGNSNNKPQRQAYLDFGRTAYRQSFLGLPDPYNAAYEFQSTIARHNVVQLRSGNPVPSLRANMLDLNGNPVGRSLTGGSIYCSDCHNSDQARSSGGTGPSGPHSSNWTHLLERRYELNSPPAGPGGVAGTVTYSSGLGGPYALCDKCHDVNGSLVNGGDTVFGLHNKHVLQDGMACSSCHAGHGIQGGDATHHGNLIDPDLAIVAGAPAGSTDSYINTSTRTCNLTCHNHTHSNSKY